MAYVPVPKDLSKVKTKVAFNLTKRQLICFAAALGVGLPLFFLLKDSAGTSLAAMAMIVVMLPCFLFAMYEKHGQPLEVIVKNCQILPGLPEAYHEPAGSGAHEETPRPCYAVRAKTVLIYAVLWA